MSGDGDDLESICSNNGIPANMFSAIVTTGWSVSTIAMGFSDASEFDQEATLRDLEITEDISRLERAALSRSHGLNASRYSRQAKLHQPVQHHHWKCPMLHRQTHLLVILKVVGMKRSHQSWANQSFWKWRRSFKKTILRKFWVLIRCHQIGC